MTKKQMKETLQAVAEALDDMPAHVREEVELMVQDLSDILDHGWVYEIHE